MDELENFSLKVKNYKCFGDEEGGFDKICPINVIIGRNNSGKSTLLELVEYAIAPSPNFMQLGHRGGVPQVFISLPLREEDLLAVFPPNQSSRGLLGSNDWKYGSRWVGKIIKYMLNPDGKHNFVDVDPPFEHTINLSAHQQGLAHRTPNPLSNKTFKHLIAERDIAQEGEASTPVVSRNGMGITNTIQWFINATTLPRKLVEDALLQELNKIYQPDSSFSRILVQKIMDRNIWEIYLEELTKGQIALSHTGSGFKTILAVLVLLYLIPHMEQKDLRDYVFAFEELENNLHPSLQRRLLLYLREFAIEHGCLFFLTTHSNVMIDLFSRDNKAQIIHVTHDGEKATTRCVQTYIDNKGILDDLDVRASDLLQANCVVWVEGPSDRLYFNRWIELWADGKLKEGYHYQCMFYGGRLLAHISAEDTEQANDGVAILRLNRNAVILIDSDKGNPTARVNKTKKRIAEEITQMSGIAWITKGREVENYIPSKAIAQYYKKSKLTSLEMFDDIAQYLDDNIDNNEGEKFKRIKVEFAARICPILTKDNLSNVLDLSDKLAEICGRIRQWNNIDDK